ncbi:uncharacterized protein VK521_007267 [Ammospiza maritima maritima]
MEDMYQKAQWDSQALRDQFLRNYECIEIFGVEKQLHHPPSPCAGSGTVRVSQSVCPVRLSRSVCPGPAAWPAVAPQFVPGLGVCPAVCTVVTELTAPRGSRLFRLSRLSRERFRCHPVGTAVLILLLLVLVLALGVALAVLAAPQVPVTPATPLLVLGCPHGWMGYIGVCYYFSLDFSTWDQGQERCSELGASLAIAQDEEAMDLLSRLCGNGDFWLGLRRRGERLHWGDGSSYSSRVPVFHNSECVYLADDKFRSVNCSNERPYVCSKAQAPL